MIHPVKSAPLSRLRELQEFGYMERKKRKHRNDGTFEPVEYTIREIPLGGFPQVDSPQVDEPNVENPQHTNKDSTDNNSTNNESNLSSDDDAPKKPLTGKNKLSHDLLTHFSELTCLTIPEPNTAKQKREFGTVWKKPILTIAKECDFDLERSRALISWAVKHFDEEGLTLKTPLSIQGIACAEQAKRKRAQAQPASSHEADAALNDQATARFAAQPEPVSEEAALWAAIKRDLSYTLEPSVWRTYIEPTELISRDNGRLRVRAPTAEIAEWNTNRLDKKIARAVELAAGEPLAVEFTVEVRG